MCGRSNNWSYPFLVHRKQDALHFSQCHLPTTLSDNDLNCSAVAPVLFQWTHNLETMPVQSELAWKLIWTCWEVCCIPQLQRRCMGQTWKPQCLYLNAFICTVKMITLMLNPKKKKKSKGLDKSWNIPLADVSAHNNSPWFTSPSCREALCIHRMKEPHPHILFWEMVCIFTHCIY